MRVLFIVSLCLITFAKVGYSEEFKLNYSGQNKWLSATQTAPLFKLRQTLVKDKKRNVHVILPIENRNLSEERLMIIAEIIGRKVPNLILTEVEGTSPAHSMVLKLPQ